MGVLGLAISKSTARRRRWPWVALALVVLLAMGWWYVRDNVTGNAAVGTAYAARVGCSCRYVAGRSLEDCAKDKLAGMEMIRLSEIPEDQSVTASVPLIASETARYREGFGCVLDPWEE
ncbi:MAG: hypothetical protein KKD08_10760 [Alphaproteobacteria bacterium]|jgi:hypothetical protein|nr:hypothetical protein [Alphaproteobacteria bacterium]